MKLSACVDALYRDTDFCTAMGNIKDSGIGAVEFWDWQDKDIEAIRRRGDELDMQVAAFCTVLHSLTDPEQLPAYRQGLLASIEAAHRLGCASLITQVGADTGVPRERQRQAVVSGLRSLLPILEQSGVTLLVEPLNLRDHPGYFLTDSPESFSIVDEVGSPYVKVLFDIYHQQVTEGDVIRSLVEHIDIIGHIHAAGNPGRGELDSGELYYPNIFRAIEQAGYRGFVGLEYFPTRPVDEGLRKLSQADSGLCGQSPQRR